MRSTKAIFFAYLAVIAAGLVLYTSIGIARNADDSRPAVTVGRFADALEEGDGATACDQLADDARDAVEKARKKPCDEGIVEMRDDVAVKGRPGAVDIAEKSAIVKTGGDEAVFLDETSAGWRIAAAGCSRQAGDLPYDCELEG